METIGPYRVLGKLGEGGMAAVYRVLDPHVEREVALKLIRIDSGESAAAAERFIREAEILARVDHPNVVRVHRLEREAGSAYLVQEIVEGETLEELIRRGRVEPRRAAEIVRALADALAAIHREEILHRDLKPANVILRPDGQPVLLDFGIARDLNAERLTQTGALLGTPRYMAPEQASGEGPSSLGAFTDVYGLGAILYELLCGQPPFAGSTFSVLKAVLADDPPWPSALEVELAPDLEGILQRAMAKAGANRYPSAEAFREDLDAFLAGRSTQAGGPAGRTRRGPLYGGALIAGVALLLAGGVASRDAEASPTPSVSASEAAPTRSKRRGSDPRLWRLGVGDEFEYVLEFEERGGVLHSYLKSEFSLRVVAVEAGSARLKLRLRSLRAGLRVLQDELPPEVQLSPVDEELFRAGISARLTSVLERAKGPVSARANLMTGAISEVRGFEAIREKLRTEFHEELEKIQEAVPAPEGSPKLDLTLTLDQSLNDDYMRTSMDLLLSPRTKSNAHWVPAGGGKKTFLPLRKADQPLLGYRINRLGGAVEVEGVLRYSEGRLLEAQLCQIKPSEGPTAATWLRWSIRPK